MKPTTPPTKQGVRRMYAVGGDFTAPTMLLYKLPGERWIAKLARCHVAVVSLEPENIDALVERAQQAVWDERRKNNWSGSTAKELASAVVRALLRVKLLVVAALLFAIPARAQDTAAKPDLFLLSTTVTPMVMKIAAEPSDLLTFASGLSVNLKTGEVNTHGLKLTDASAEFWKGVQLAFIQNRLTDLEAEVATQKAMIAKQKELLDEAHSILVEGMAKSLVMEKELGKLR